MYDDSIDDFKRMINNRTVRNLLGTALVDLPHDNSEMVPRLSNMGPTKAFSTVFQLV